MCNVIYIIARWTESNDGDVHGNHGKANAWIVKPGGKTDVSDINALVTP